MMVAFRAKVISFLIPSFLSAKPANTAERTGQHGGIHSLDGLRGIACVFVVNEHVLYNFSKTFLYGYAVSGNYYVVQWPFVRILWCGLSMVNIFFVISGYVLSYKPLSQIHGGDSSAARATLASSTFRRIPRLYLPMWVAVVICGVLTWLGFFQRSIALFHLKDNPYQLHEGPPIYFASLWDQMRDVLKICWHTLDVFTMKDHLIHAEHYDLHTWTIPVEFRCSMILFGVLSAVSQFKMRYRILLMTTVGIIVMMMKQKNTMMFLTGAILSDIDCRIRSIINASESNFNHHTVSRSEQLITKWLRPNSKIYPVLFIVGIYLLCVPTFFYAQDPLYAGLISMVPLQQFNEADVWLRYYGSITVVWAVANSTKLKPIFVNPVSTYLGKISFALYLVHGDVIRCLLYSAIPTIYSITGDGTWDKQTSTQMFFSMFIGMLLVFPLSLYLSDLFMKGVDVPITRLGRRLELAMVEDHGNRKTEILVK